VRAACRSGRPGCARPPRGPARPRRPRGRGKTCSRSFSSGTYSRGRKCSIGRSSVSPTGISTGVPVFATRRRRAASSCTARGRRPRWAPCCSTPNRSPPADLEVLERQLESRIPGRALEMTSSRLSAFSEATAGVVEEIGIARWPARPTRPAQLIQLPNPCRVRPTTTMVLALGMSSPDSIIVEQTRRRRRPGRLQHHVGSVDSGIVRGRHHPRLRTSRLTRSSAFLIVCTRL